MGPKNLLFLVLLVLSVNSNATVHTVNVANYYFSPTTLTIAVGDTITWVWVNGTHTTSSTTVPIGAAPWDHSIDSMSTSFSYVPTVAGMYNYVCSIHASMGMNGGFTAVPTAVKQATAPIFTLFPNPATGVLNICLKDVSAPVSVCITDLSGKQLIRETYAPQDILQVNTAEINNGIYLLQLKQGEGMYHQRIVINR